MCWPQLPEGTCFRVPVLPAGCPLPAPLALGLSLGYTTAGDSAHLPKELEFLCRCYRFS